MSYFRKIRKVFEKNNKRKAVEVVKQFDESKQNIGAEIEGKKDEFQAILVQLYKASDAKTQALLKNPTEATVVANSSEAQSLLQELTKADFPGSSTLNTAVPTYGIEAVASPLVFLLLKASVFVRDEPSPQVAASTPVELKPDEASEKNPEEVAVVGPQETAVLHEEQQATPEEQNVVPEAANNLEKPQESVS